MTKARLKLFGGVTGRDGYLMAQALAYAIVTIQGLPPRRQEISNAEDMGVLLKSLVGDNVAQCLLDIVRRQISSDPMDALNGKEISIQELGDFAQRKGWSGTVSLVDHNEHGSLIRIDVDVDTPEDYDRVRGEWHAFIDGRADHG